jgi:NAD(P)-dependent dehydrogenase (short-subunit alcohol dehydrogenase family)
MNIDFSGQVVVVAGGTGGLGRAVSREFLLAGARVIVTYYDEAEFRDLQELAGPNRLSLEGHAVDVTDVAGVAGFLNALVAKHGKVDSLVNTVGGYAGGVKLRDLEPKIFDRMLDLNLRSGYILARAVMPIMLKTKHAPIVNVAAKAAIDHGAGAGAYAASKAAAVALMDSLAADARGTGVRVNSILPSIIDTPANRRAMPDADFGTWPKPGISRRSFCSCRVTSPGRSMALLFRSTAIAETLFPVEPAHQLSS